MPPPRSYIISGIVRVNSLIKGYTERTHTIDTNDNGQSDLDLYIGGGTTTTETVVYIKNITQDETKNVTSGSDGIWLFDCANFATYENNDEILIWVSTYTTRDTDVFEEPRVVQQNTYHKDAKAIKNILVNRRGNEYNIDNPIPVKPITEDFSGLNYSLVWTHDSSGRMITETRTYKGESIRRTWSFTGSNYYADSHSSWVEI